MRSWAARMHTAVIAMAAAAGLALVAGSATAESGRVYERVHLEHGISLEIPKHWSVLSMQARQNLLAFGEAAVSAMGDEPENKHTLLAVNAVPSPTGAVIRVSVITPAPYGQQDLAVASKADLRSLEREMFAGLREMEKHGGAKVHNMLPVKVSSIGGYRALEIPYVRAGVNGPSDWQVTMYQVPHKQHMLEITLSHRLSDGMLWKPILEHVKRSIRL